MWYDSTVAAAEQSRVSRRLSGRRFDSNGELVSCTNHHTQDKEGQTQETLQLQLTLRRGWIRNDRFLYRVGFPIEFFVTKALEISQLDPRQTEYPFSVVNRYNGIEVFHADHHGGAFIIGWWIACFSIIRPLDYYGTSGIGGFPQDFLELPEFGGLNNRQHVGFMSLHFLDSAVDSVPTVVETDDPSQRVDQL